jgi:hypothetical protein
MPILSDLHYKHAIDQIEKRTAEGLCFALGSAWLGFIEPFIRNTMKDYNVPNWAYVKLPYKEESIQRLYRKMCDGKVYRGDKQERARICARVDLSRHVLEAAARVAMITSQDGDYSGPHAIRNGFLYCEDTVTDFLEDNGKFTKDALRGSKKIITRNKKCGFSMKALSSAGIYSL